jgi:hypothetical protein
MEKLEKLILTKHNLTKCTIIDSKTGRLDIIVEPDISIDDQYLVEDTVDEYMGEDWEGFAIIYNVNEINIKN